MPPRHPSRTSGILVASCLMVTVLGALGAQGSVSGAVAPTSAPGPGTSGGAASVGPTAARPTSLLSPLPDAVGSPSTITIPATNLAASSSAPASPVASATPDAPAASETTTPAVVAPVAPAPPAAPAAPAAPPAPAPAQAGDAQAWASATYSITSGPNTTKRVVLSYDDCPKSLASFKATLLSAEQQGIALVLFPIGTCVKAGQFDVDFARAHGHYVFNHSAFHRKFGTLSPPQLDEELGPKGVQTAWGRSPYGQLSPEIRAAYARAGMRIWLWSVDTLDWSHDPAQAVVVQRAVAGAGPSGTILMHMQHNAFNPDAIAQIKAGLAAKGLEVCRNQGPTEAGPRTINC